MARQSSRRRGPNDVRLDDLDDRILWELMRDGRIPNNALAQKVGVSPSTTLQRMKALRESGALRSIHAQVDLTAMGLPIQAMVLVRLRPQARPHLRSYADAAIRLPQVLNLFFVGGADDFLIHVACASTEQLRDFVARSLSMDPAVASTQTHIIFDHLIGAQFADEVSGPEELRAPIRRPASPSSAQTAMPRP